MNQQQQQQDIGFLTINEISQLANDLIAADEEVGRIELELKAAKERARIIREETIPGEMQEAGLKALILMSGQKLSIRQEVYASIPAKGKDEAFNWLDDNGFGGVIKSEVKISIGKGEMEIANRFIELATEMGADAEFSKNINAMTLKALIREQLASGSDFPLDLFGARPVWQAKITQK